MKVKLQNIMLSILGSVLIYAGLITNTFAEETKLETDSVNDITLNVIFHFRESVETVKTFKVFDTLSSGFDRTKPLIFKLEGVIGEDKPLLYKAIDMSFLVGKSVQHDYSEFDVDVIFQHGNETIRQFSYGDCQIKNYNTYTEYDREETYNGKTKFVYLDRIDFDCRGFALENPIYEMMLHGSKEEKMDPKEKIIDKKMLEENKAQEYLNSLEIYKVIDEDQRLSNTHKAFSYTSNFGNSFSHHTESLKELMQKENTKAMIIAKKMY